MQHSFSRQWLSTFFTYEIHYSINESHIALRLKLRLNYWIPTIIISNIQDKNKMNLMSDISIYGYLFQYLNTKSQAVLNFFFFLLFLSFSKSYSTEWGSQFCCSMRENQTNLPCRVGYQLALARPLTLGHIEEDGFHTQIEKES